MADIFHMHTDLMRTSRLQAAFHQCHISQTFQHGVMGNGRLSLISFGKYRHLHPVARVASDITFDTAFVVFHDAPYQGTIFAFSRLIEKLHTEMRLCFRLLGYNQ